MLLSQRVISQQHNLTTEFVFLFASLWSLQKDEKKLFKVYMLESGSLAWQLVALVLEEQSRYIRAWLGGSVARRLGSGRSAWRTW